MVENGVFIHKIDYVTTLKVIQIPLLVQSNSNIAEWVDCAYWWSFSGGGSAVSCQL